MRTRAEKAELLALLEERARRKERDRLTHDRAGILARCRTLYGFIEEFWSILEPTRPFVGGWAIKAVCDHLEAVTAGRIQYLLITVPPGMMKSLAVAVFWPAWEWGPAALASMRFLTSSYSEPNVLRDNQKMRRLVESEKYQTLWGDQVQFARDQNAKGRFENTATGMREGRAFGSMTGGRGDRVIIDDPHSVDTAESDTQRAATVTTFREAIPDRLNDMQKSAIVVIMQRLHERDVAGTILALGLPYEHLNLPMEFEPERRCRTSIGFEDPRHDAGELLFPERFPRAEVDGLKKAKGSYAYAGQYQQRPTPRDGGLFKRHWFEPVLAVPASVRRTRAWDLGATRRTGANDPDPTAGLRLALGDDGIFYIETVERFFGTPGEVERALKAIAAQDPAGTAIRIPQDPGQAGKSQAATLIKLLAGYDVRAKVVTGDKYTRAIPAAAQAEAGNVRYVQTGDPVKDAWIEAFLDEMAAFPSGKHDDQVDAFADALNDLAIPEVSSAGFLAQLRGEMASRAAVKPDEPEIHYAPGSVEWAAAQQL